MKKKENDNRIKFERKSPLQSDYLLLKTFRSYMVVSVCSSFSVYLASTIDSLIVGNLLGVDSLALIGLANPLITLLSAASGIVSYGSLAVSNILTGKGQGKKSNTVFTFGIILSTLFALLLTAVCFFGNEFVVVILGAKEDIVPAAAEYVKFVSLSFVPIVLSTQLNGFTKRDGSRNLGLYAILAMMLSKIALNFLFAGYLGMGMVGIALASVAGNSVSLFVNCIHFFRKFNTLKFAWDSDSLKTGLQVLKLGTPSAVDRVSQVITALVLNHLLMGLGGVLAVAAYSVVNSLSNLIWAIPSGVGSTLRYVVGLLYGETDLRSLNRMLALSFRVGIAATVVLAVVALFFDSTIVTIFGLTDPDEIAMVTLAVRFLAISLPFSSSNFTLISFYQSTENTRLANLMSLGHNLVFPLIVAFSLAPLLGVTAVWVQIFASEVITLLLVVIYAFIKEHKFRFGVNSLTLLPSEFGEGAMDVFLSVKNSPQDAISKADEVRQMAFFSGHSARLSNLLAVCTEEITESVMRNAFRKKNKVRYMDLRIIETDEWILFGMRDDGVRFNPFEEVEDYDPSEDFSEIENVGDAGDAVTSSHGKLGSIKHLSVYIQYHYSLNLNTLTVIFRKSDFDEEAPSKILS